MTPLFFSKSIAIPHEYVKTCVEYEYGHHRTPWMQNKIATIQTFFTDIFGDTYIPLILTNTYIGACEAVVTNLSREKSEFFTITNSSWLPILESFAIETRVVSLENISDFSPTKRPVFLLDDIDSNETKYNLEKLVNEIRSTYKSAIVIVNATKSFASDSINWKLLGADVYIISPHGALGGIVGLSIVITDKHLLESVLTSRTTTESVPYTLDLKRYYEAWKKNDTPFSPDISALVALSAACELIIENGGFDTHVARQHHIANAIRELFTRIGATYKCDANSATTFSLPSNHSAEYLFKELANQYNIFIESYNKENNCVSIGHQGHFDDGSLARLEVAIQSIYSLTSVNIDKDTFNYSIPKKDFFDGDKFKILPREFYHQAIQKAENSKDPCVAEKIVTSAQAIFTDPFPLEAFAFTERTIGFIGAGRTVKETVLRCQKIGINKIKVFSPSLASRENVEAIRYWGDRKVEIIDNAEQIFLECHTVILLPTFYNALTADLYNKDSRYVNEAMVNNSLLEKVRDYGKMDLLINASARSELIDRKALNDHLEQGWLRFISDETPLANDLVTKHSDNITTGHIGGSSAITKEAIAENTREILRQLCSELFNTKISSLYKINHLNSHLRPPSGWRGENNDSIPSKEIRVLLTDIFDLNKINFEDISHEHGIHIDTLDASSMTGEDELIRTINEYRPNIMMIRTKTIITEEIAESLSKLPSFYYLIRPGVGVENMSAGMRILSSHGIKIMNEPLGNSSSVGEMTTRFITRGIGKVILTPGPTPYCQDVFKAMHDYQPIGTDYFQTVLKETRQLIKSWIQLPIGPIMASSPSTGLMEAAIKNLTRKDDKGFVISHGKFGNRFIDIAIQNKRPVSYLKVDDENWGKAFSVQDFEKEIKLINDNGERVDFLCLQQNETSSGISYKQNHLVEIVKAAREHNPEMIIIVDAVSGLFAHNLDFSNIDVDMVITGSQKGLGVSSGLSYATLSNRATKRILEIAETDRSWESFLYDTHESDLIKFEKKQQVHYFSLPRLLREEKCYKNNTIMSIFHILATNRSLKILNHIGHIAIANLCDGYAKACRESAIKLGLELPVTEEFQSAAITFILLPSNIDASLFRKTLEQEYGFIVSGAQNEFLKPRLIRVGHTGYIKKHDTIRMLRALKILLREKRVF